ncbi:MAG: DNA polymerase III subunit delta [Bacteroidales bacterium]|nr:DNA polymerase III subunit delta [Bacteroidales bacterium]
MQFKDIVGHINIKKKLIETVTKNRISHAQLFLGNEGSGKMSLALAYAQYVNCENPTETDSCGECKSCKKIQKIAHPDLHFVYPVVRTPKFSKPVSTDFIDKWREFLDKNKHLSYNDWLNFIGTDNLQGSIYAQESQEIIRIVNLKTFEAKYKILIIYMPEKMNISASNKLLKAIEEPPPNTLFILVSEDESQIITTIRSRTQLIKIENLSQEEIIIELSKNYEFADNQLITETAKIANGNYIYAKNIVEDELNPQESSKLQSFNYFSTMMRAAYGLKINEIITLSNNLSTLGREKQKEFLIYSNRMIRENFILNETKQHTDLNYLTKKELEFSSKFSIFITEKNIFELHEEFNKAYADIERNASAKILFLDLILKIAQLLKKK